MAISIGLTGLGLANYGRGGGVSTAGQAIGLLLVLTKAS